MITIVAPTQAHTPQQPYCRNVQCWCHCASNYHALVVDRSQAEHERMEAMRRFIRLQENQKAA